MKHLTPLALFLATLATASTCFAEVPVTTTLRYVPGSNGHGAVMLDLPWAMLPFLAAAGVSFGLGWAFLSMAVVRAAEPAERDMAAGLVPTVQSAGYALGAALTGLAASQAGLDGASAQSTIAGFAWVVGCGLVPAGVASWVAVRRRDWP